VDFAGSDTAMTDEEAAKVKQVYFCTAGGAVAVVYNIPGVTNLKLSARCFQNLSGQITMERSPDCQR